jgi:hypothetical protein
LTLGGAVMECTDSINWLDQAAEEFNSRENRRDGSKVAACLADALTILRESLYLRVYDDVEKNVGKDSMLTPISETKTEREAIQEIEIYQVAESAAIAKKAGYVGQSDNWYLPWLARLRLKECGQHPDIVDRCKLYLSKGPDDRRHQFMDLLSHILPESREAPLVLFRIFPLSVQIATARAFGDRILPSKLRREQIAVLPAITDCRHCHGQVLECVEQCRACGNPLWKYEWLIAVD